MCCYPTRPRGSDAICALCLFSNLLGEASCLAWGGGWGHLALPTAPRRASCLVPPPSKQPGAPRVTPRTRETQARVEVRAEQFPWPHPALSGPSLAVLAVVGKRGRPCGRCAGAGAQRGSQLQNPAVIPEDRQHGAGAGGVQALGARAGCVLDGQVTGPPESGCSQRKKGCQRAGEAPALGLVGLVLAVSERGSSTDAGDVLPSDFTRPVFAAPRGGQASHTLALDPRRPRNSGVPSPHPQGASPSAVIPAAQRRAHHRRGLVWPFQLQARQAAGGLGTVAIGWAAPATTAAKPLRPERALGPGGVALWWPPVTQPRTTCRHLGLPGDSGPGAKLPRVEGGEGLPFRVWRWVGGRLESRLQTKRESSRKALGKDHEERGRAGPPTNREPSGKGGGGVPRERWPRPAVSARAPEWVCGLRGACVRLRAC